MKLWLASYPRSGNTFFRNVLFDCYKIESAAYDNNIKFKEYLDFETYDVVKTHELFENLPNHLNKIPSVYLIRDGRDAIVSQAYQMINILKNKTKHHLLLVDIIISRENSNFGGWSNNVDSWFNKASVIIRFEDLINHPIESVNKISAFLNLPQPNIDKLPTFFSQKLEGATYGNPNKKFEHFFRKGIPGSWRDDMPKILQNLFWLYHGKTMQQFNYVFDENYDNKIDKSFWVKKEIIKRIIFGTYINQNYLYSLFVISNFHPTYMILIIYYSFREFLYFKFIK